MSTVSADRLLTFLANPGSYPYDTPYVDIIQTHISYVAIAPPFVYKVKKPVSLGFLDFSTLDKRKHFCEEELRLNRRLCGHVYDGVIPIFDDSGTLSFDPGGRVVEYAVKMHQLPEDGFMHRLVQSGQLDASHVDLLIDRLVSFYLSQSPSEAVSSWGDVERIRMSTDENFAQTNVHVGRLLTSPAYETIRWYTNRFLERNRSLFDRRKSEGRIVDGHGDLHLEHVHLQGDRLCIYDCIEFSERLRCIDVANDVAFLAMDLDYWERPDLSRYFAHRMRDGMQDPELLRLLPFYKCYRSYVRGKVEGMRTAEPEVPESDREDSRQRAVRYYQLSLDYAMSGNEPMVLVVMGRVGVGKTTIAHRLADALGWPVVSSDVVRKTLARVPLHTRGDAASRQRLYAPEMTARTYEELLRSAVDRAQSHHSTILDATYGQSELRRALADTMREARIDCRFLEITSSDRTIRARLQSRDDLAAVTSDARLEDFGALLARYETPEVSEGIPLVSVRSEGDADKTTLEALKGLVLLNE
ncbi:MAG: AAA family ATPase [Rhodothermales bacterium]|nr:AAA family ATPase [Rhodothermales bacterium]